MGNDSRITPSIAHGRLAGLCGLALTAQICAAQLPSTVPATAPTTAPLTTQASPTTTQSAAAALIDQLSSADPRQRRQASEKLIALGEDARPLLEDLLQHTNDLDVITRAQAALEQIDEDRMVGPSYVTLHFKNAPAGVVAAELGRQSFAPLLTFPENLWDDTSILPVSIDLDHQPFWVAMRQFSEQTGVGFQPYLDGHRLMRVAGRPAGIAVVQGPFLIVANQISRSQSIELGLNGAERSDFSVQMCIYPEPKIVVVRVNGMLDIQEAVDDNGNSLLGPLAERSPVFIGGPTGIPIDARLSWPKNPGKRIVRLVCSTTFELQTKSQKLEIADILTAKEQTQTLGGSTVSFKGIHKNGEMWELQLSASTSAPLQQMMQNRLQLLDSQGRPLERRGMSGQGDAGQMTFHLLFAAGRRPGAEQTGDPSRLVWDVPVETKPVPLQFEFRDLPMPD
jgi:hypothetical protein